MSAQRPLIEAIRLQFALDWEGIHGSPHWARVRANGLKLARSTGADTVVLEYFALLHDSRRENDGSDPDHGPRAADWARELHGRLVHLDDAQLELLCVACAGHTHSATHVDVTVMTCWDADRLDLGRVGIRPDPRRLCTEAARDPAMIEWAYAQSVGGRRRRGKTRRR